MKSRKIVTICLIIIAFFLYLVASQFTEVLFDWFNFPITREFGLTVPEFIGAGIAVIAFVFTVRYERAMIFFEEAVAELAKVVYPTRKESSQAGVVVVILVAVAMVCVAVFDWMWSLFTRFVIGASA